MLAKASGTTGVTLSANFQFHGPGLSVTLTFRASMAGFIYLWLADEGWRAYYSNKTGPRVDMREEDVLSTYASWIEALRPLGVWLLAKQEKKRKRGR